MIKKAAYHLEESIIVLLLVSMTLLVFVEVVDRFFLEGSLIWMEELTLHLSAWMVLFGASWGVKEGAHIGVDFVVQRLSILGQKIATLIALSFGLSYCALIGYGGWIYLKKLHLIGIEMEDIPIPKWIAHSILLIGMVLLAWRLLVLVWQVLKGEHSSFKMSDEADQVLKEYKKGEIE